MTSLLVGNIGTLVTNDTTMGTGLCGTVADAAMVVADGKVVWTGPRSLTPRETDDFVDAGGRAVVPGFVDSHAHLVFAGDRSAEFLARTAGQTYGAGGIFTTVASTRAASDADLAGNVERLMAEALAAGTTTMECKSGYGLTPADEARSLRVAGERTAEVTYLGAHVVPPE